MFIINGHSALENPTSLPAPPLPFFKSGTAKKFVIPQIKNEKHKI